MADDRKPISIMEEIVSLLDTDIFYVVRPTEPIRAERGKKISVATMKTIFGQGGGGGEPDPGEPATQYVTRAQSFRGNGIQTRFTLDYTPAAPNELALGSRALVWTIDYYFDGNDLVFYSAPEQPANDAEDNIAISYRQQVGESVFLKDNQGLQSVLGVGNAASIDMALNARLFANEVHTDNVALPPYATQASAFIVAGQSFMRRLDFGTGFEIDYVAGVINALGGSSSEKFISSFQWNSTNRELRGVYNDTSLMNPTTLSGVALTSQIPTNFVPTSGGQFNGRVNFESDIRLTGGFQRIFSPNQSSYLGVTDTLLQFTAANSSVLSLNSQFAAFNTQFITMPGFTEIQWNKNQASDKLIALGTNNLFYLRDIPAPAGTYTLPPATASVIGGVKPGAGLAVLGDGTIYFTGTGGDGNNYSTSLSFGAISGSLSMGRAGLSTLSVDLYTPLDNRYLKLSDYTPGGGGEGVTGTAGRIPVFDASVDGVGDSIISQSEDAVIADAKTMNFRTDAITGLNINLFTANGVTKKNGINLNTNGLALAAGGLQTAIVDLGDPSVTWLLGTVINGVDVPATRRVKVNIGNNKYYLLAIPA